MSEKESSGGGKVLLLSDAMRAALGEVPPEEEQTVAVHKVGRDSSNFVRNGIRYRRCGGGYQVIRRSKGE